jgi:type II secretory pathway component PulF
MLHNGTPLAEALALAENMERPSPAAEALGRWRAAVESGQGKPSQWTGPNKPFPPLFTWLVEQGGEDVADGFEKAANIFRARASYRIELALYGALPISILFLGQMILWQVAPMVRAMGILMNMLGDTDSYSNPTRFEVSSNCPSASFFTCCLGFCRWSARSTSSISY